MGDQYLLFAGICFVSLLINGLAQNVLWGAFACGLHLCFNDRARGHATAFERLFKGFDYFLPSFVAILIMFVAAMIVTIPFVLAIFGGIFMFAAAQGNENAVAGGFLLGFIPLILIMSLVVSMVYIPFLFAFGLIVDQKLNGWEAIKASWSGARKNFWGLYGSMLVYSIISMACALMCYVPLFFVVPLQIGAIYLVYRDVFPNASDAYPPATDGVQ